jgi:hypothetical protein
LAGCWNVYKVHRTHMQNVVLCIANINIRMYVGLYIWK